MVRLANEPIVNSPLENARLENHSGKVTFPINDSTIPQIPATNDFRKLPLVLYQSKVNATNVNNRKENYAKLMKYENYQLLGDDYLLPSCTDLVDAPVIISVQSGLTIADYNCFIFTRIINNGQELFRCLSELLFICKNCFVFYL